uniref:Uncharacterized protein n=1 Tax=Sphaerodactylus townsendi TaxID=933632 RepID=A0ACB8FA44_9SAUR
MVMEPAFQPWSSVPLNHGGWVYSGSISSLEKDNDGSNRSVGSNLCLALCFALSLVFFTGGSTEHLGTIRDIATGAWITVLITVATGAWIAVLMEMSSLKLKKMTSTDILDLM